MYARDRRAQQMMLESLKMRNAMAFQDMRILHILLMLDMAFDLAFLHHIVPFDTTFVSSH